ncbi:UNVERIFIED_CONTAM: hypothetical protein Slati_1166800, partial [Sesamum latifolium]
MGKNPGSSENAEEFEQWVRADCLVISWLLNSMSKGIVESTLYFETTRELWLELEARCRVSNGPMIYQLQREIASATQGTLTEAPDLKATENLMQFLMELSDSFDHVRDQILMMEPLPNITKVYSMALKVEKQREVSSVFTNPSINLGIQTRGPEA